MATPPACMCVTKESPEQALMVILKFLWGTYLGPKEDASPISGKNEEKEQAWQHSPGGLEGTKGTHLASRPTCTEDLRHDRKQRSRTRFLRWLGMTNG